MVIVRDADVDANRDHFGSRSAPHSANAPDITSNIGEFNFLGQVLVFAGIYWLVSARKWFTGPRVQGSAEELAAIEEELTV
ncbi:MAG TPA: hypothetical protein VGM53_08725 [Streptosporangiaceae bacterium]